jgi:hypothetical protein
MLQSRSTFLRFLCCNRVPLFATPSTAAIRSRPNWTSGIQSSHQSPFFTQKAQRSKNYFGDFFSGGPARFFFCQKLVYSLVLSGNDLCKYRVTPREKKSSRKSTGVTATPANKILHRQLKMLIVNTSRKGLIAQKYCAISVY